MLKVSGLIVAIVFALAGLELGSGTGNVANGIGIAFHTGDHHDQVPGKEHQAGFLHCSQASCTLFAAVGPDEQHPVGRANRTAFESQSSHSHLSDLDPPVPRFPE